MLHLTDLTWSARLQLHWHSQGMADGKIMQTLKLYLCEVEK